jgi:sterol desaturase/sphingolipid hydroxylase (fatty acid hydroxylase superfamily)
MTFEPGFYVVVVAVMIFYLRLMQLRGRRRKEARAEQLERMRTHQKESITDQQKKPMIKIRSWWLVGVGAVMALVGLLLMYPPEGIPADWHTYWWIIATVGFLVFTYSVK